MGQHPSRGVLHDEPGRLCLTSLEHPEDGACADDVPGPSGKVDDGLDTVGAIQPVRQRLPVRSPKSCECRCWQHPGFLGPAGVETSIELEGKGRANMPPGPPGQPRPLVSFRIPHWCDHQTVCLEQLVTLPAALRRCRSEHASHATIPVAETDTKPRIGVRRRMIRRPSPVSASQSAQRRPRRRRFPD
jgi:hypothetical protein